MEPNVLTVTQAAEELGITPGAVRDAIARGALAAVRTGGSEKKAGHLLIMKDEVARYRREQSGKMGAASPRHSRIGNRHPRKDKNVPALSATKTATSEPLRGRDSTSKDK